MLFYYRNSSIPLSQAFTVFREAALHYFSIFQRRTKELESQGFLFVGSGVSGGEEGARYGPSLMPGGSPQAWPHIQPIFQAIAAKVDGQPCCDWVGDFLDVFFGLRNTALWKIVKLARWKDAVE